MLGRMDLWASVTRWRGTAPFASEEGTRHFTNKTEAQKYSEEKIKETTIKTHSTTASMKKTDSKITTGGATGRAEGQPSTGPLKATTPDQERLNDVVYGGSSQEQWEKNKRDFDKSQAGFEEVLKQTPVVAGTEEDRQRYALDAVNDNKFMQSISTMSPRTVKQDKELFDAMGTPVTESQSGYPSINREHVSYAPSSVGNKRMNQDYWVNKNIDYLGRTEDGNLVVVRYGDRTIGGDKSIYNKSGNLDAHRVWTKTWFEVVDPKNPDDLVACVPGPDLSREDRNASGYVDLDSFAKVVDRNGPDESKEVYETMAHSESQFHGLSNWMARRAMGRMAHAENGFDVKNEYSHSSDHDVYGIY